jgi:hypothetical protein
MVTTSTRHAKTAAAAATAASSSWLRISCDMLWLASMRDGRSSGRTSTRKVCQSALSRTHPNKHLLSYAQRQQLQSSTNESVLGAHKGLFKDVFNQANGELMDVFGMALVELSKADRVTVRQKRGTYRTRMSHSFPADHLHSGRGVRLAEQEQQYMGAPEPCARAVSRARSHWAVTAIAPGHIKQRRRLRWIVHDGDCPHHHQRRVAS